MRERGSRTENFLATPPWRPSSPNSASFGPTHGVPQSFFSLGDLKLKIGGSFDVLDDGER